MGQDRFESHPDQEAHWPWIDVGDSEGVFCTRQRVATLMASDQRLDPAARVCVKS